MSEPKPSRHLGQVFTRPEVVRFTLDEAGYIVGGPTALADGTVIEPGAGEGAFVCEIVRRLLEDTRARGRDLNSVEDAIVAFEIDGTLIPELVANVRSTLVAEKVSHRKASRLAMRWVRREDFLLAEIDVAARWVVGNPPYVRAREIPLDVRAAYQERWRTVSGRADLYVAFIEAGVSLLAPDGRLSYVCPDNWMRNDYGRGLRDRIAESFNLVTVTNLSAGNAFESEAGVYPSVFTIGRGAQGPIDVGSFSVESGPKAELLTVRAEDVSFWQQRSPYWPRWSSSLVATLPQIWENLVTLEQSGVSVRTGLATGRDEVFLMSRTRAEELGIENEQRYPAVRARELSSGREVVPSVVLVYPTCTAGPCTEACHPGVRSYLESCADLLASRRVGDHGGKYVGWRTIDRVESIPLHETRLLIPDVRGHLEIVKVGPGVVPLHGITSLVAPDWDLDVLAGLMISDFIHQQLQTFATPIRGGSFRTSGQYLRNLRIPGREHINPETAGLLAHAFHGDDRGAASGVVAGLVESVSCQGAVDGDPGRAR